MTAETCKIWDENEHHLFKRGTCLFILGSGWGAPNYYRTFRHEDCEKLMGCSPCHHDELMYFADTACVDRMFISHITNVLVCNYVGVDIAYFTKQTGHSGLLEAHYDTSRCKNCYIIIIGIYEHEHDAWLNRGSRPTRGGV